MPATETVHIRVDERVKSQVAKTLSVMGLAVSDAVRVQLTHIASEKALPFDVKIPNGRVARPKPISTLEGAPSKLRLGGVFRQHSQPRPNSSRPKHTKSTAIPASL